jgi:hypothetical protein
MKLTSRLRLLAIFYLYSIYISLKNDNQLKFSLGEHILSCSIGGANSETPFIYSMSLCFVAKSFILTTEEDGRRLNPLRVLLLASDTLK